MTTIYRILAGPTGPAGVDGSAFGGGTGPTGATGAISYSSQTLSATGVSGNLQIETLGVNSQNNVLDLGYIMSTTGCLYTASEPDAYYYESWFGEYSFTGATVSRTPALMWNPGTGPYISTTGIMKNFVSTGVFNPPIAGANSSSSFRSTVGGMTGLWYFTTEFSYSNTGVGTTVYSL